MPGAASTGANRSGGRCLIKGMARGSRPRRSWAFSDAVVDTILSVVEQVHPMAVQLGLELTDSPPLSPQECVEIKSCLALSHVVDRPGQFMSQDRQGFALAMCVLQAGKEFLRGGMIPQA